MDRIFRLPRTWSNAELRKFAPLFTGDVANVSAWKDEDKEGHYYKDYFINASSYSITNYRADAKGLQGLENETFLDLEQKLPVSLQKKFEVVYNHTVLEHVFEVDQAFSNLCSMAVEVVIIVVPFLQKMHAHYGDYWRFTPLCIKKMFEKNSFELHYCSYNSHPFTSVYLFCIGMKQDSKYKKQIPNQFSFEDPIKIVKSENFVGVHAIQNPSLKSLWRNLKVYLGW